MLPHGRTMQVNYLEFFCVKYLVLLPVHFFVESFISISMGSWIVHPGIPRHSK